jgi:hypothetical protein
MRTITRLGCVSLLCFIVLGCGKSDKTDNGRFTIINTTEGWTDEGVDRVSRIDHRVLKLDTRTGQTWELIRVGTLGIPPMWISIDRTNRVATK